MQRGIDLSSHRKTAKSGLASCRTSIENFSEQVKTNYVGSSRRFKLLIEFTFKLLMQNLNGNIFR